MNQPAILLCFILALSSFTFSCKPTEFENRDVESIVLEFYAWYITSINQDQYGEYQPSFVPDPQGMTSLEMSRYVNNLRRFHVSEELIEQEISSFATCQKHLETIPYETFDQEYMDLDQFEEISCDFGNSYRWFGSQEGGVEKARWIQTEMISPSEASIHLELIGTNNSIIGEQTVYVRHERFGWKIVATE